MSDWVYLTVKYTGAVPGIARKLLPGIKKTAYGAAGVDWHRTARPKHFTKAGASEYGYAPRKGEAGNPHRGGFRRSYTGQKLAKMGHTRPLVYTGQSMALTRLRDVRATSTGARVVMNAPGLNRRNPASKVNPRAELTALSDADRDRAARTIDQSMDASFKAITTTETKQF